jgi:hypothetical protein
MKRIMDHVCLKSFDHLVVMNQDRQMIGWIKRHFNSNRTDPNEWTTIEICEFKKNQLYPDPKAENPVPQYVGFNDEILHGKTIFGITLIGHNSIESQLTHAGLTVFNMTP